MKRYILTAFLIGAAVFAANASATTYDLQKQWPSNMNPKGQWRLVEGTNILPHDGDWTPISSALPEYNPVTGHIRQPAWAPGNKAGFFLPAWFKAAVSANSNGVVWNQGDVVVHTTDAANGIRKGIAMAQFTVPSAGTAKISGTAWNARNMNRSQEFEVLVNGTSVAIGLLAGDGTSTRAHPSIFNVPSMSVSAGDIVTLEIYRNGEYGDLVGCDMKIVIAP